MEWLPVEVFGDVALSILSITVCCMCLCCFCCCCCCCNFVCVCVLEEEQMQLFELTSHVLCGTVMTGEQAQQNLINYRLFVDIGS